MKLHKLKNWYGKYERPISSISLVGGFVFDAVTLKRVDLFWENVWVVGHLVIVAVCILLVNALEKKEGDEVNPSTKHFWLVNILQFFFGGILSTYLVFYFRSSDLASSWPFLLVLALSFWANEALKRHFVRLIFQISLLFLSIYAFAIFIVPVILHKMNDWIFLLSGLISLFVIAVFLWLVRRFSREVFESGKKTLYLTVAGIFILVNIMYFTNLIPPIPLSLKDAGVYHSLYRNSLGNYVAVEEVKTWQDFFKIYPTYEKISGEPVFVYSAIFSPPMLNTTVVHQWQKKDEVTGEWQTKQEMNLKIIGGRDGGFRTYSQKLNIETGKWRVNVLTTRGQVIGRIRFKIESTNTLPKIQEKIKE